MRDVVDEQTPFYLAHCNMDIESDNNLCEIEEAEIIDHARGTK